MDYEKQAQDFLNKTGVEFSVRLIKSGKYWNGDKEGRDIYEFTLKRGSRVYTSRFGQSISNSRHWKDKITGRTSTDEAYARRVWGFHAIEQKRKSPAAYDILASITEYNPGTFEDFCSEYEYDTDSKSAEKTYHNVVQEWLNVTNIWSDDEMEQLKEIQ